MPYMFSQGAADVLCTLLHFVGGKLVDVAKGRIDQPGNRVFHGNPMPLTLLKEICPRGNNKVIIYFLIS